MDVHSWKDLSCEHERWATKDTWNLFIIIRCIAANSRQQTVFTYVCLVAPVNTVQPLWLRKRKLATYWKVMEFWQEMVFVPSVIDQ